MCRITDENIILRWSGKIPGSSAYVSWYIRGVYPDGRFYGEVVVRDPGNSRIFNVDGSLTHQDNTALRQIVSEIQALDIDSNSESPENQGYLGMGAVSKPSTIVVYSVKEHCNTEVESLLFGIVSILVPYMQENS